MPVMDNGSYQFAESADALTTASGQETVEAIRITDRLSDAAGGDGVDIVVGADELSFQDNWLELAVRQNAYTNYLYTNDGQTEYTEVEVRGTFKSELVQADPSNLGDYAANYETYEADRLRGEAGNDILIGGAGGDEFEGGYGDDILLGGSITADSDLVGVIDDSWIASDKARYFGPVERFEVSRKYVNFDDNVDDLLTTLKAGGVGKDTGVTLYDTASADRVDVIVVSDSLSDDQGGLGTDILFGIEQIEFNSDDSYARIDTRPSFEVLDWDKWFWDDSYYDNQSDNGVSIEGTIFDDTVNVADGLDLPGTDGFFRFDVRASQGNDTYVGMVDGYERLEYKASKDEFVFTLLDDGGVRVDHVLSGGIAGAYGTDILYNIDSINFSVGQTSDVRLLNLFEWREGDSFAGSRATQNDGYFKVRTSIQDDFVDLGSGDYVIDPVFGALRPSNLDVDNSGSVSDLEATIDATSIDTAPQLDFIASAGDDVFVGGANFDRVRYGLLADEIQVERKFYVLDQNDDLSEGYATEAAATGVAGDDGTVMAGIEVMGVSGSGFDYGTDVLFGIESLKFDRMNGDEEYIYLSPVQRVGDNYVSGTRFADRVESDMTDQFGFQFSGDDRMKNIELFGGDDFVDLSGVGGSQRVVGGDGDDTIDFGVFGSDGLDVARFYGLIDDFTITFFDGDGNDVTESDGYQSDGYITVTDNVGSEGTDTITGADGLNFNYYYDSLIFEEDVKLSESTFRNTSYLNLENADPDGVILVDGVVESNAFMDTISTTYGDRQSVYQTGGVVIDMSSDGSFETYQGHSKAAYGRTGVAEDDIHLGRFVEVNSRSGLELFDGYNIRGTAETDVLYGSARIDRFYADSGNDVYIGNGTKGLGPLFDVYLEDAWDDADEVVYRGLESDRFDLEFVDNLTTEQIGLFNAGFSSIYSDLADQSGFLVTDSVTGDVDFLSGIDRVSFAEWEPVWLSVREEIWDSGTRSFTGTDLDDRIVSEETEKHNIKPGGGDDVVIGPDFFGTLSIGAILDLDRDALYDSYSEVEYNGQSRFFTIESKTDVDLNSDNVWDATGLRYDPAADRDYRTDGPNDPPEYFLVTDTRDGWNGSDVIFGVERIRFSSGDDSDRYDLVPFFELDDRDFWDVEGNQTTAQTLWVRDGIAGYDYTKAVAAAVESSDGLQSVSYEANYGDDRYVGLASDDLYSYVWEGDTVRFVGRQSDFDVEVLSDIDGDRVVRVTDLRDGGYGTNTLVNIETIRFEDPTSETNNNDIVLVPEYRDWDNDGNIDSFEGTQFGDVLVGDGGRNDLSGGAGNDNLIGGPSGDWMRPGSGHDFVDGSVTEQVIGEDYDDWQTRNEVNFNAPSDRITITSVYVGIDDDGFAIRNADGSFKTYSSAADAEQDSGGTAKMAYYAVDDLPVGADGSIGTNVLINVDAIGFNDDWFELSGRRDERDWDGDGVIDEVFSEGTPFDDELEGSAGNDYMNAREGDDHLTGLGGGDNLRGGLGNDVIDGGANGNTGDPWRDLDTAEYNGIEGRYTISGAQSDVDEDSDGVWDATLRAYNEGDAAPIYYTVSDSLDADLGGTGTDVLVGIERIRFRESEIDLGLRVYTQDWDEDGQVDWSEVRGTINDDSIVDGEAGLDLSNDDEIRGRDGNDIIVAGAGGDRISGGAGNDFIDGGDNGTPYGFDGERLEDGYTLDQISWQPKDEVRYDGDRDRFEIYDSSDLTALTDLGLTQTVDDVVTVDLSSYLDGTEIDAPATFKVIKDTLPDAAGGYGIDIVANVEFISFSDDFIALQAETYVNYDSDGNEIGRSVNGTLSSETLLGGAGDDNLWGKDGDDVLRGKAGGDWLEGGAGNDTIHGGKNGIDDWGNERYDTAVFSGDYSEYEVTTEDRTVDGVAVVAVIVADSDEARDGTDTLYGVEQLQFMDQWIQVTVTQESMFDHEGNETGLYMRGSILGDTLSGDSFGDILEGGAGNDTINGGGGADRIYGGLGNDTIDGGANGLDPWGNPGQDVAVYEGIQSRYTVTFLDADGENSTTFDSDGSVQIVDSVAVSAGGEGTDTLVGIERVEFSDSSLSFQSLNVFVDLDGDGFPDQGQVFGTTGDDTLTGSEFDEKLIGDAGKDVLYGGAGGDRLDGGAGNDVLVGGLNGAPDASGRRRPDVAEIDASVSDATIANSFVLQKDDGSLVTNTEASGFSGLNTNTESFGAAVFDAKSHDISGTSYTWSDDGAAKILSYTDADGDSQVDVLLGIEVVEFNDAVVSTAVKTNQIDFDRDGVIDEIGINGTLGADTIDQSSAAVGVVIDAGPGDDTVSTGSGDDQVRLGSGTDSVTDASSDDFDILILQGDRSAWTETSDVWTHTPGIYGEKTVSGIELIQFDDGVQYLSNQVAEIDADGDGEFDGVFVKLAAGSSYSVDVTDDTVAGLGHTLVGADITDAEADVLSGGNGADVLIGGAGANTLIGGANVNADGTVGADVAVFDGTYIDVTDDSGTTTQAEYDVAAKFFVMSTNGSISDAYDTESEATSAATDAGDGEVVSGFTVTDSSSNVNKVVGVETLQFTDGVLNLAPTIDIDKAVKPTGVVETVTVRGTQFADTIAGQAGADDVLIGGDSLDQFVFGDESGFDQILDFVTTGTDTDDDGTADSFETIKIQIDEETGLNGNTNIEDASDVLNLVNSSLDGALIDLGGDNQILVVGVDADDLTASHIAVEIV